MRVDQGSYRTYWPIISVKVIVFGWPEATVSVSELILRGPHHLGRYQALNHLHRVTFTFSVGPYNGTLRTQVSDVADINSIILKWSGVGPQSCVVVASELHPKHINKTKNKIRWWYVYFLIGPLSLYTEEKGAAPISYLEKAKSWIHLKLGR